MENNTNKKPIRSFRDLEVYQVSYIASVRVANEILTKLPASQKFDLIDQLSRSTKAVPRLIAEGYAKKHQKAGFQKYLDDALAEINETIVGLEHARDIYHLDGALCEELVALYDRLGRQTFRLAQAWNNFKYRSSNPTDQNPQTKPTSTPNNQ